MAHEPEHTTGFHPSFMQYVMIAIILFAITIVEFLLIWDKAGIVDHLGASKIPLLVGLSAVKFAIVIMFYMHLKFDNRLFGTVFLAGLVLAFMVGLALLGLFTAMNGDQRTFAENRAIPYDEHGGTETPVVKGPIAISAVGETLTFDTNTITAESGSEVTVAFTNPSSFNQHNLVIVEAGTKDAVGIDGTAAGQKNNWVPPEDPRVIANTVLIGPGESINLTFTAPAPGTYQFVCTFPGHYPTMFGEFVVKEEHTKAEAPAESTTPASGGSTETETQLAAGPVVIAISAVGNDLAFDTKSLSVKSGDEVTVNFGNPSTANSHNFVIVQDGTKDDVARDGLAAGADNEWIKPDDDRIIANTVLIGPGGTGDVTFAAPAPGAYQFVCTFPGHNLLMFGDFVVN